MLKYRVDSLDEVDEQFRGLYKETKVGDKTVFILQVEGAVPNERLKELRDSRETFRKNNVRLSEMLKRFAEASEIELTDDLTPEEVADQIKAKGEELKAKLEAELGGGKGGSKSKEEIDKQVNARVDAYKATQEAQIKKINDLKLAAEKERDRYFAELQKMAIENEVLVEARKLGLKPGAEPFVVGKAREIFRLIDGKVAARDKDDPEQPLFGSDGVNELTIPDFVDTLRSKDAVFLFEASSGGGATGGSGGAGRNGGQSGPNPWKEGSINLTRQMALMKSDPAAAKRLKAEAGVK